MPRMIRLMPVLGVLCMLSFAARPAGAAEDYAALAPPDAMFFIGAGDIKALADAWPKSAPGKLWADPEIIKSTRELRDEFWKEFDPELKKRNLKREDILRLVPGQAAFWIENLDDYKPLEYGFVFVIARTAPPAEYIKLIEDFMKENVAVPVQNGKEAKLGVDVYSMRWDMASTLTPEEAKSPMAGHTKHSLFYAFPEGKMVVAFDGDQSVERLLRRAQKSGESLAATPDFAPLAKSFTPAQVRVYAPVGATARVLHHHALGITPTPPGETEPVDLEVLGLYDFKTIWAETRLTGKTLESSSRLEVAANPRGLAKAVMSFKPLDPAILRAVPVKPVDFTAAAGDFGPALADAVKTLQKSSPQQMAPMIGILLAQAQMQLGVSLLDELLPAFGSQFVSVEVETGKEKDGTARVFAASVKSPEAIIKAVENVKKIAPANVEQGEAFMGATIWNFKGPEDSEAGDGKLKIVSTLALGNGHAVFSNDGALVRDTVRRLSGKDAANYNDAHLFKEPASGPDGKLCSYSRVDVGAVARLVLSLLSEEQAALAAMAAMAAAGGGGAAPEKIELPPKEVFERLLGVYEKSTWFTPTGLASRSRLPNTPEGR